MIELPPGYLLRRPLKTDAEAIAALMIACDIADSGEPDTSVEDLMDDWALPRFDLTRDAWLVIAHDRALIGYAWLWDRKPHVDFQGDVHVLPGHRGRSLEAVLLRLLEERASEHRTAAPPGERVRLNVFAQQGSVLSGYLEGGGYARIRTFLRMTINLKNGYPEPSLSPGVEIRPFRLGIDEVVVHEVIGEAFADHFRFVPEPHDEWVARRTGHAEFDPDLWLVAWEGERAAGAVLPYQFGDLSWIRELGVRTAWRGRGIGKALLLESFRAFERRGKERVSLGVDAENVSGATRLYENVGMSVEQRHDLYQLEVIGKKEASFRSRPEGRGR